MSGPSPVHDWATDFDHSDPRWIENPYPIWEELRRNCPIARTERFLGAYFPSVYADVKAIAYDTEHFSSRRVIVRETRPPLIPAPPITSDPPAHRPAKQVLLINTADIGRSLPHKLYGGYVELTAQRPAVAPAPDPVPPPDVGGGGGLNLAYAVQWWLFIAIAVGGWFTLIRREARDLRDQQGRVPVGPSPMTGGVAQ